MCPPDSDSSNISGLTLHVMPMSQTLLVSAGPLVWSGGPRLEMVDLPAAPRHVTELMFWSVISWRILVGHRRLHTWCDVPNSVT